MFRKAYERLTLLLVFAVCLSGCSQAGNNTTLPIEVTATVSTSVTTTPVSTTTETPKRSPLNTEKPTQEVSSPPSVNPTQTPAPTKTLIPTATLTPKPATPTTKPATPTSKSATPTQIPTSNPTSTPTVAPVATPSIPVTPTPTTASIVTATPTPGVFVKHKVIATSNGPITEAVNYSPDGCVVVVTIRYDHGNTGEGYRIGGLCTDGSWDVDREFEAVIKRELIPGELQTFVFETDKIKKKATGDINVNFYEGFTVVQVTLGSPSDNYPMPTSTVTPVPIGIAVDSVNFPDENLRSFIINNVDPNHDGVLTEREVQNVSSIKISNGNIRDFTGLEFFYNLGSLEVNLGGNAVIDFSKIPRLSALTIKGGTLANLDLSNNTQLCNLIVEDVTIRTQTINLSSSVWTITLNHVTVSSLNLGNCPDLLQLELNYVHGLPSLDVSRNPKLESIILMVPGNSSITSLDVSNCKKLNTVCLSESVELIGASEGINVYRF